MGYATEAVKAMINYARTNFGARKFASQHCEPNIASGNVMRKCYEEVWIALCGIWKVWKTGWKWYNQKNKSTFARGI